MENLPFELLKQCLSYLTGEEKTKCLRVCKTWNEKLRVIAYETVAVASEEQLTQMYTFFHHNEECGKFVKNLFIIECKMTLTVYTSLPTLFPHIKKFYVKEDAEDALPAKQWSTREAKTQFAKWKDTIEDITEVGSPICTEALFTETVCPNLKSLELACLGLATEMDRIRFIKKLKTSAPNLTHLKLLFMALDFHNMEELLNNTPNLKVLALTEIGFLPPPTKKKLDISKIKPHPGLETLAIRQGSFCRNANKWIDYFSNKFIYLKNLCINRMEDNQWEGFCNKYDKQMVNWVSKLSQLEYYRVEAFDLTKKIVEAMDTSGMQLKRIDLRRVYSVGHFYQRLLDSKQKDTLETISSIDDPYEGIVSEFKDFVKRLGEFKNLKHLSIFQNQSEVELPNKIPLDLLIKHAPNLETLKMDFGEYIVEYDKDEPMPDCNLKTLVLIEFSFNAVNRFKDTEEGREESWEYLEKTVLPNTEFVVKNLEDTIAIEEEYSQSICNYKEYPDCEYETTTYDVFQVL